MSMQTSRNVAFAGLLVLSVITFGCAPAAECPPPASPPRSAPAPTVASLPTTSAPVPAPVTPPQLPHRGGSEAHVYRFDFVLTVSDGSATPTTTSFTLTLEEGTNGEVAAGRNVPLSSGTAAAPGAGSARQDIGLKVVAHYRLIGDDVLLDVSTEMSTFDPPAIRKVTARGNAFAAATKPALVMNLDEDKKHYQLVVTPTKLR